MARRRGYVRRKGLVGSYWVKSARPRRRRRKNPTRLGNTGIFHRNPGGGGWSKWLLIGGAAAAGLYFFGPQLSRLVGGAVTGMPGYAPIGGGLYRGPDGALYARNPQTGAMVKAPTGTQPTSATDLLTRAGVQALPAATNMLADWVRGLFTTSATGAPSATTPRPGASTPSGSGSSFPTGAIGAALPALPAIGNVLFTGGSAPDAELPPLSSLPSVGNDWFMGGVGPDAELPPIEAIAPMDDWAVDWGTSGFDLPDLSYDVPVPDFDFGEIPAGDFDFGFMGLGRRHRGVNLLRRPASFR